MVEISSLGSTVAVLVLMVLNPLELVVVVVVGLFADSEDKLVVVGSVVVRSVVRFLVVAGRLGS